LAFRPGNVLGTHAIEAASASSAASAAKVYYFYFSEVPKLNEKCLVAPQLLERSVQNPRLFVKSVC